MSLLPSAYPYTAYTFGSKNCELRQVEIVEQSAGRNWQFDAAGHGYRPDNLFATEREALLAIKLYLDRKQAEVDKIQVGIDKRRKNLRQQLSICK